MNKLIQYPRGNFNIGSSRIRQNHTLSIEPELAGDTIKPPLATSVLKTRLLVLVYSIYILSIPFETMVFKTASGYDISLSRLFGLAVFIVVLLQRRWLAVRIPNTFWGFAGFELTLIYSLTNVRTVLLNEAINICATCFQLLLFFVITHDLVNDVDIRELTIRLYCFASLCLASIQLCLVILTHEATERLSVLGMDYNFLAAQFANAVVILVCSAIENRTSRRHFILNGIAAIFAFLALSSTGSRGATVALFAGIFTVILGCGNSRIRKRFILIMLVFTGAICLFPASISPLTSRLAGDRPGEQGKLLTGREVIFPEAIRMFAEKPAFGWGPVENEVSLGERTASYDNEMRWGTEKGYRATHNVLLWVVTACGLIGGILYLFGLGPCILAAVRARHRQGGLAILAALICTLIMCMSINAFRSKAFWTILACASSMAPAKMKRIR